MTVNLSRHALGRMTRDVITDAEIAEALTHPTHAPRPVGGRLLARRVHAHTVLTVLYQPQPNGAHVISCWKTLR